MQNFQQQGTLMINNGMCSNEDLPDDPYLEAKEGQETIAIKDQDKPFAANLRKILMSNDENK